MSEKFFTHPQRVIRLWAGAIVLAVAALLMSDVAMVQYADAMRDANPQFHLARALELIDEERFVEAKPRIDRAAALAPGHPEVYVARGHLHFYLDQWKPAIAAYKEAFKHGDNTVGVRQMALWSHIEAGLYDQAVEFGENVVAEFGRDPVIERYLAEAHLRAERFAEAIPHLERAVAIDPNELYLLERLRQAYDDTGAVDKARKITKRIVEIEASLRALAE